MGLGGVCFLFSTSLEENLMLVSLFGLQTSFPGSVFASTDLLSLSGYGLFPSRL